MGGVLGEAVPQAASAGNSAYCTGSWVCVYKNSDFGVPLGYRGSGFARENLGAANDNEVSSWENRTSRAARWHTERNGGGTCHNMAANTELNWMSLAQNDNMSSWAGNGAC